MAKKDSTHYIDNKEFFKAMSEWKILVIESENTGDGRPPVTEYIGECFLKIAEHLAYKPNFMNYVYKEEMIGDGIENCLMYAHNFDPEKSKNPFSYFTQIIYYAFLRRIEKEKKQSYIKFKCIRDQDKDGILKNYYTENYFEKDVTSDDQVIRGYFNLSEKDVKKFEPKKKKKKKKTSLDDVLEGDKSENLFDK
ncbi:MAG: hypothetical protein H8D80_00705 [Proteobacteria bacterium]|nr:hypothetical protein [Pseudomonadota bacterium]